MKTKKKKHKNKNTTILNSNKIIKFTIIIFISMFFFTYGFFMWSQKIIPYEQVKAVYYFGIKQLMFFKPGSDQTKVDGFKVCDLPILRKVPNGSIAVIGHAYGSPYRNSNPNDYLAQNVEKFLILMQCCSNVGFKRIIFPLLDKNKIIAFDTGYEKSKNAALRLGFNWTNGPFEWDYKPNRFGGIISAIYENKQIYYGRITYKKEILWVIPISVNLTREEKQQPSGYLPYDSYGGGAYTIENYLGPLFNVLPTLQNNGSYGRYGFYT